MSTTAVLDPAAAVRALSAELHDKLQQLLDTTSRYDPELLDKVRALSGSLGKRLTNARKRVDEQPAEQPKPDSAPAAKPTTPAAAPKPDRTPDRTPTSTPRVLPARMRPAPDRPATVTIPTRPSAPRGRHRATTTRRPRRTTTPVVYRPARHLRRLPWLFVLAVLVLVGATVAATTGQPLAAIAGSAAAVGWLLTTRTRVTPPVTRQAAVAIVTVVLAVTLLTVAVTSGRTDGPPTSPTAPPEVSVIGPAP